MTETLPTMPPNEAPLAQIYERDDQHGATVTAAVPENQIRVEDKLYSTEKLADLHPGGPLFIKVGSLIDPSAVIAMFCHFRRSLAAMRLRLSFRTTVANSHTTGQSPPLRARITQ